MKKEMKNAVEHTSQLGTRPPLRNIPLFGDILF